MRRGESPAPVRAFAPHAEPTAHRDARHKKPDENCQLGVHITVDGLETEEQKDLQRHQRESRGCHRSAGGCALTALAAGKKRDEQNNGKQRKRQRAGNFGEIQVLGSAEPHGIARPELRAPKNNIEGVSDGRKVAVHGR